MDDPFFRSCYPTPKKVVSIPIRFMASEKENSKSESALKIQKAFRGFRVRNNVHKILAIRRQVDNLDNLLQDTQTLALIKTDPKERLKITESLMNLLFTLDSVPSVNPSVRDFRKAAINKAIMLQDKIDSLITASHDIDDHKVEDNSVVNQVEILEDVDNNNCGLNEKIAQIEPEDCECVGQGTEESKSDFLEISERDRCQGGKGASDEWCLVSGDEESKRSSRKLLEKMAEDNQKLMAMVAQLCDRSAAQANLISSLSHRVDQLEKAIKNDISRKKKKKKNLNAITTAP